MLSDAVPLHQCSCALVIKLRHHGDVLLASPVPSVLKARAPRMEIDALVYDDTVPMLEGHPAPSQVHVVGRNWRALCVFERLARRRRSSVRSAAGITIRWFIRRGARVAALAPRAALRDVAYRVIGEMTVFAGYSGACSGGPR